MTIEITAYKTSDGKIFESKDKADYHQSDILGELLGELIAHDKSGRITQTDRHGILMNLLKDPETKRVISKLHEAYSHDQS